MDRNSYPLTIAKARLALSDAGTGAARVRRTRATGFTLFPIDDDISLRYRNIDLYIRGFQVGDFGYYFSNAENFTIAGGTCKALSYSDDYKGMGWNRQGAITVTTGDLGFALENIRHSKNKEPDKTSMLRVALAFAEGVRFDTVVARICDEQAINPADVSWDAGPGTRVLRCDH